MVAGFFATIHATVSGSLYDIIVHTRGYKGPISYVITSTVREFVQNVVEAGRATLVIGSRHESDKELCTLIHFNHLLVESLLTLINTTYEYWLLKFLFSLYSTAFQPAESRKGYKHERNRQPTRG